MKKNMTITKKESRSLHLNEITMSKQLLIYVVKDELFKFYTHKLSDFDAYSNFEKEKLINLLQNLAHGRYNKVIKDEIPNEFPFEECYNAKIVIEDALESCGNLKLKINLTPSWMGNLGVL